MNSLARSLATRLIDAIELYVNASRAPGEDIDPPGPRPFAWLAVDGRRDLRDSAAAHEISDRTAAS